MKRIVSAIVLLTVMASAMAQGNQPKNLESRVQKLETEAQDHETRLQKLEKKVRVTPYGFVRNYFNYDSRNTYTVVGGEYHFR